MTSVDIIPEPVAAPATVHALLILYHFNEIVADHDL